MTQLKLAVNNVKKKTTIKWFLENHYIIAVILILILAEFIWLDICLISIRHGIHNLLEVLTWSRG